jgi:hypothetical protein
VVTILKDFITNEDIVLGINILSDVSLQIFKDNPAAKVAPESIFVKELLSRYSVKATAAHTVEGFLTKWDVGSSAGLHVDNHDGYEFLEYSTVVYLNDDFEGGEIYFPRLKFTYKPNKGDAVIFPCNSIDYVHGVTEVTSGTRYTLAMWHTTDITKISNNI